MKDIKCKYIISFGIKDNIIVAIVALLFDTAAYFMYRQGTAVYPFCRFWRIRYCFVSYKPLQNFV